MRLPAIREIRELFKERHNKRGYYDFVKTSLCLLVATLALLLFLYDILENFELTTLDYRMRLRRQRRINDRIALINMDERSIREIGRWPWPRERHAEMISALSYAGADVVIFDVIFSEPSSESSDSAMEEAMKESGTVYIPYAVELEGDYEEREAWNVRNVISPLEMFSRYARGEGHITTVPDQDGTIRRIPLIIEYNNKSYIQLSLEAACGLMGFNAEEHKVLKTPFGRYIEIGRDRERGLSMPVDEKNQMLINWAARWQDDFRHYSYADVAASYRDALQGKKSAIDLTELKDKICIIGLTTAGLYDIKPIPLQPAYPAVGTNANIINNILNKDFARRAPRWADALIIIILGLLLSMSVSKVHPVKGAVIAVSMIFGYLLISFALLDNMNIWISLVYPLVTVIFSYLVIIFYNQIVISAERLKLYTLAIKDGLTGLFVIRHFNLLLEAEMERAKTRGGRLSILMADIDHFKRVNDTYGHHAGDVVLKGVADIVTSCCRQLDIPSRYGGEEFILMLPGADINEASLIAQRIRKRVEEYNFRFENKTYKVTISIGAATFNHEERRDDFVKRADEALYKAKKGGRNRVCVS